MPATTDARIDAYIAKATPFAQPILTRIRKLVHKACPDVAETTKWGMPHFDYKGTICSMAAFRQHCAMSFPKAAIMNDPAGILTITERQGMGHMGNIATLKDLPADKLLLAAIKEAVRLNEENIKIARPRPDAAKELEIPAIFTRELNKDKAASKVFESFSYSAKKEYVTWVTEAKTEATRNTRLQTAIEWIAEGKTRHWKHKK